MHYRSSAPHTRLLPVLAALNLLPLAHARADEPDALTSPPIGAWELPPHRHTVFLNFAGGNLKQGNIAAEDQAGCFSPVFGSVMPAWAGTQAEADAVLAGVKEAMAPFGVRVVAERPPKHLPYSMVMLGGISENANYGVACAIDCADQWRREVGTVTLVELDVQGWINSTASVIGRQAGLDFTHGFDFYSDLMVWWDPRMWATECAPLADYMLTCLSTHELLCGEGSMRQNDFAELTAVYGENSVDVVAPTVKLLAPADGTEFPAGAEVVISAEIADDFEGFGWRLVLPELGQEAIAYKGETEWTLKPPVGTHIIQVEAIDHDRNIGIAEVTIHVGVEAPDPTTGGETTGDETTEDSPTSSGEPTSGESGEGGEGDESGDVDTADSDPNGETGCSCATDARPGMFGLLGLLGLGLVRRRSAR